MEQVCGEVDMAEMQSMDGVQKVMAAMMLPDGKSLLQFKSGLQIGTACCVVVEIRIGFVVNTQRFVVQLIQIGIKNDVGAFGHNLLAISIEPRAIKQNLPRRQTQHAVACELVDVDVALGVPISVEFNQLGLQHALGRHLGRSYRKQQKIILHVFEQCKKSCIFMWDFFYFV